MPKESESLLQCVENLEGIINKSLQIAGIETTIAQAFGEYEPANLTQAEKKFLEICKKIYNDTKKNLVTTSKYPLLDNFKKDLAIETQKLSHLKAILEKNSLTQGVGYLVAFLLLGIPFLSPRYNDYFFTNTKLDEASDELLTQLADGTEEYSAAEPSWLMTTLSSFSKYNQWRHALVTNQADDTAQCSEDNLKDMVMYGDYYLWTLAVVNSHVGMIKKFIRYIPLEQMKEAVLLAAQSGDTALLDVYLTESADDMRPQLIDAFMHAKLGKRCKNDDEANLVLRKLEIFADKFNLDQKQIFKRIDVQHLNHLSPEIRDKLSFKQKPVITHTMLRECGQKLGYALRAEGICQGYTMRWIEATLLKQQQKFKNRTYKIAELHQLLSNPAIKYEDLAQQDEWKDVLWDIKAFYESLLLYQCPEDHKPLFGRKTAQDDVDVIASIASSDAMLALDGIKKTKTLRYDSFNKYTLGYFLRSVEEKINACDYNDPVCFLISAYSLERGWHAINITYNAHNHEWSLMDINNNGRELDSNDLNKFLARLDSISSNAPYPNNKYLGGIYSFFSVSAILPQNSSSTLEPLLCGLPKFSDELLTTEDFNAYIMLEASRSGDGDMLKKAIGGTTNINRVISYSGDTPLFMAVQNGHFDIVKILLEEGADINQAAKQGATPLYMAAQKGDLDIFRMLLEKGADINQVSYQGNSVLFVASSNGHVDVVGMILEKGVDINWAAQQGVTPLLVAAQEGHVDVVRILLEKGADFNQIMSNGVTPLFIAANNGHFDVVKILLEEGADINQAMNDGTTPLFIAAQNGHFDVVEALLNSGADPQKAFISTVEALTNFASRRDESVKEKMANFISSYPQEKSGVIHMLPQDIAYIMNRENIMTLFSDANHSINKLN